MGFFSKKKQEDKLQELPPLKFPEFPKEQRIPSFDAHPETEDIKNAVSSPPNFPESGFEKEELYTKPNDSMEGPRNEVEGNTLFVKIENFKSVKEKMDQIKDKIQETEKILDKIDELRKEEEHELTIWNNDLNSIKTRLLAIDKNLFE